MIDKIFLTASVIGVPISVAGALFEWPPLLMFSIYCLTIIALAYYMGKATESLSIISGERIGGLLNATFGNAVELLISIFSLKAGLIGIVLAALSGSVIGNLLLNGGLSFFIGGLRYKRMRFNIYNARHNSGLLMFAVIVAFLFPKVFSFEIGHKPTMTLSIWSSIILILLYMAALLFKLVTHRGVYTSDEDDNEEKEEPQWGFWRSLIILIALTIAAAFISDHLVDTFKTVSKTLGWSKLFIGIIIVAIIGNAGEYASSIMMAYKNKVGATVEISVGSTLQVAMFVAPVLVLISLFFNQPMSLIFTVPEMVSMVLAVLLNIMIMNDGDTNWFEGATLLAAYLLMGVGFYLL